MNLNTLSGRFEALQALGFQTPPAERLTKEQIPAYFERMKALRPTLDYEIDGLVFSVDNIEQLEAMGVYEDRQKPKGQIALKFPAQTDTVTIKVIHWSADGVAHLSPVGLFDPIMLAGAQISRSHLKSIEWMTSRDFRVKFFADKLRKEGYPSDEAAALAQDYAGTGETVGVGSVVEIARSGDVIPTIKRVVSNIAGQVDVPCNCPACGGPVEREGAFLNCINEECRSKEAARMRRFLTNLRVKGLDVDTLVLYADAGVTVQDFFLQDNFKTLESKIQGNPEISWAIWLKVKAQLL